jgi:hypothetical protein
MLKFGMMGGLLLLATAVFVGLAQAEDKAEKTHDGFVVAVAADKLVMADKDGKNEHTHAIGADCKITLNNKAAKITDLKKDDAVKVTTGSDGKVTAVAATRKDA